MVICLEQGADLHMFQLTPLPLTVSCSSKIQIGFTFLVPAHPGSPGKRAVKRVCVANGQGHCCHYVGCVMPAADDNCAMWKVLILCRCLRDVVGCRCVCPGCCLHSLYFILNSAGLTWLLLMLQRCAHFRKRPAATDEKSRKVLPVSVAISLVGTVSGLSLKLLPPGVIF